jgi:hypothetical protein
VFALLETLIEDGGGDDVINLLDGDAWGNDSDGEDGWSSYEGDDHDLEDDVINEDL